MCSSVTRSLPEAARYAKVELAAHSARALLRVARHVLRELVAEAVFGLKLSQAVQGWRSSVGRASDL